MNIHEIISPEAMATVKTIGYGLIVIAVTVIALAGLKLQLEAKAAYDRWRSQ